MLKRLTELDKKTVVRFAVSLFVVIFLLVFFFTVRGYAANAADVATPSEGEYLDHAPQ